MTTAIVPMDEVVHPRLHGLLSDREGHLRILRIAARPELGSDLIAGNFTDRTDSMIVIATFNHGKRFPTIHGECRLRQPEASERQND